MVRVTPRSWKKICCWLTELAMSGSDRGASVSRVQRSAVHRRPPTRRPTAPARVRAGKRFVACTELRGAFSEPIVAPIASR
jgi:hypothetical protein